MQNRTISRIWVGLCLLLGGAWVFGVSFTSTLPEAGGEPANGETLHQVSEKSEPLSGGEPVDYAREVLPILSDSCFLCHGPDQDSKDAKRAGFRLDLREEAVDFAAIVPGKPDESLLIEVIEATNAKFLMPPPKSGKPRLTKAQVQTLRRWIEQGAEYETHWSFAKPTRPELPEASDPDWPRNRIDQFVLAKLDAKGLAPMPEADKRHLIRRVSLDLIGLPPTPEQVDAFIQDDAPGAYDRVVDRLLASERYGEHWARQWLDKARYADSKGFAEDGARVMWRYRDWVIDAYNSDMPFDVFTRDQIAGDLVENPTLDHLIATGFHRNTQSNSEGGTDDEEFRNAAVIDRVNTTMEVWMGLTAACAQCHTHKYDPLYHEEYYKLFAYFNQTADADRHDEQPKIPAPTPEQAVRIAEIESDIQAIRSSVLKPSKEMTAAQKAWEKQARKPSVTWWPIKIDAAEAQNGTALTRVAAGVLRATGQSPARNNYRIQAKTDLKKMTAIRLETLNNPSLPNAGPGRSAHGNFVLSNIALVVKPAEDAPSPKGRYVRVALAGPDRILSLAEVQVYSDGNNIAKGSKASQSSTAFAGPACLAVDNNTDGNIDNMSVTHTATEKDPWWEVDFKTIKPIDRIVLHNRAGHGLPQRLDGALVSIMDADHKVVWQKQIGEAAEGENEIKTNAPMRVPLVHSSATFEQAGFGVAKAVDTDVAANGGWAIGPRGGRPHAAVFEMASAFSIAPGSTLQIELNQSYGEQHTLGQFRLSATDAELPVRAMPADVASIISKPLAQRSQAQAKLVEDYFKQVVLESSEKRNQLEGLEREHQQIKAAIPTAMVMRELPAAQQRTTNLFLGGSFLAPDLERGPLEPGTPAFLHPLPHNAPSSRLGLAQWLTHPDNPLTARVQVNRLWEELFGQGLVKTTEDFGFQGSYPSHPKLLDDLASRYQGEMKWSMKALIREIVTSATYRQSSAADANRLALDPFNELYARGPRFRLSAEQIRDQALAVAGLMHHEVGGPSVLPYLPKGMLPQAFDSFVQQTSIGDNAIYRRGLYTAWRRTGHYPSFAAFDAPDRIVCTAKRSRTNTPMQALVTLNDPVYVEAAQGLGRRLIKHAGGDVDVRIERAFELALARKPARQEKQILKEVYRTALEKYRDDTTQAHKMAADPRGPLPEGVDVADAAAMTVVANVVLNLDEFLTKP